MPIKRLQEQRPPAFPCIGELRKGAPREEGKNRPGKDLTFFRFTARPGFEQVAAVFAEAFGDEPREIRVFLPYASADENLQAWQEEWVAGGLVHRCDGETCVLWQTRSGGYSQEPRPCPGGCRQVGRLSVILPDLRRLAYVTVLTTSLWDIIHLTEQLRAAEGTAALIRRSDAGDLRGIPFLLRRTPTLISTPRNGQRVRVQKWLLSLELAPDWVERMLGAVSALADPEQRGALPAAASRQVAQLPAPALPISVEDGAVPAEAFGDDDDESDPPEEQQDGLEAADGDSQQAAPSEQSKRVIYEYTRLKRMSQDELYAALTDLAKRAARLFIDVRIPARSAAPERLADAILALQDQIAQHPEGARV